MSLLAVNVNLTREPPAPRGLLGSARGHRAERWEQATHGAPNPLHYLLYWGPQRRHMAYWALELSNQVCVMQRVPWALEPLPRPPVFSPCPLQYRL